MLLGTPLSGRQQAGVCCSFYPRVFSYTCQNPRRTGPVMGVTESDFGYYALMASRICFTPSSCFPNLRPSVGMSSASHRSWIFGLIELLALPIDYPSSIGVGKPPSPSSSFLREVSVFCVTHCSIAFPAVGFLFGCWKHHVATQNVDRDAWCLLL